MKKFLLIIILVSVLGYFGYWGIDIYQFSKGVQADIEKYGKYDNKALVKGPYKKKVVLSEDRLGALVLSELTSMNIEKELTTLFPKSQVTKQVGQQDGPDFILYEVMQENNSVLYASMDPENSVELSSLTIVSPEIVDLYGLSVGSTSNEIKIHRPHTIVHADFHLNIYAGIENSKIKYRLIGDFKNLNDTMAISENYSVEDWQISEMKIEFIIWEK